MPTLFQKKSMSSLSSRIKAHVEEKGHARKLSMASTSSQSSTASTASASSSVASSPTGTRMASYDPLSMHPPLRANTAPFFAHDNHSGAHPVGPASKKQSYAHRRMTYIYDQDTQWPLKDWQAVPPGLAELDYDNDNDLYDDYFGTHESSQHESEDAPATALSPRPANHQRRPTDWMDDPHVMVKRGAWKRQGIVFHLDSDAEQEPDFYFQMPQYS